MLHSFNCVTICGWSADISCVDFNNTYSISSADQSMIRYCSSSHSLDLFVWQILLRICLELRENFALWLIDANEILSILQTINGTIQMSVNKKFQHVKRHAGPTSLVICLRNFMKILPCEWSMRTKFSISYKLSTRTTSLSEKDKLWRLRKIPSCRTSVVHWVRFVFTTIYKYTTYTRGHTYIAYIAPHMTYAFLMISALLNGVKYISEFSNEYDWEISLGPLYGWNDVRAYKGPTEIGFLN